MISDLELYKLDENIYKYLVDQIYVNTDVNDFLIYCH